MPAEAALEPETPEQRIVQALADAETPLSQRQIRERAATRATTVTDTLQTLIRERRVERAPGGGYRLAGAGKARTMTAVDGKNPRDPFPESVSEQPGTWVTVLTGDMGNMFQFLFMLH